jgi:hypothetical protein
VSDALTKTEAAITAKLSERSIDRAIAAGELAGHREHGRVCIARAELARWIQSRQYHSRPRERSLTQTVQLLQETTTA